MIEQFHSFNSAVLCRAREPSPASSIYRRPRPLTGSAATLPAASAPAAPSSRLSFLLPPAHPSGRQVGEEREAALFVDSPWASLSSRGRWGRDPCLFSAAYLFPRGDFLAFLLVLSSSLLFPLFAVTMARTVAFLQVLLLVLVPSALAGHDYASALSKGILFFEAQRSGYLPPDQRVKWRSHSGLHDGKASGVMLTSSSLRIPNFSSRPRTGGFQD